jgi:Tubulin/FtsZ family, GTPase domain
MLIHIGQAGISIGLELWRFVHQSVRESNCSAGSAWFHDDGLARCVAIDSEPRVLADFQNKLNFIRPSNLVHGSGKGCANNWAAGFSGAPCCGSIIACIMMAVDPCYQLLTDLYPAHLSLIVD